MKAIEFVQRLELVRRSASGWVARCPAHTDRNPSLSITERNGRILLHCHAGCTVEAVCAALAIRIHELFSESRPRSQQKPAVVRFVETKMTGLRSRLTPMERERPVTVVIADRENPDTAIARALALSVEGDLVQIAFAEGKE